MGTLALIPCALLFLGLGDALKILVDHSCSESQLHYSLNKKTVTENLVKLKALHYPQLIHHPCNADISLYMWKYLYLTFTGFQDSTTALQMPHSLERIPNVKVAVFVMHYIVMKINYRIYTYNLRTSIWRRSLVSRWRVNQMSAYQCCYSTEQFCQELMSLVFLYPTNYPYRSSNIYFSEDNGESFTSFYKRELFQGILEGVYFLPSIAAIGILLRIDDQFHFRYISMHNQPLQSSIPFKLFKYAELTVLRPDRFAGILLIWNYQNLLFSPNNGLSFCRVTIIQTMDYPYNTLPRKGAFITHVVTSIQNEIVVCTNEGDLFYGRLSVDALLIKIKTISNLRAISKGVIFFNYHFNLVIMQRQEGFQIDSADFFHCIIWIDEDLSKLEPPLPNCMVQYLESNDWKTAYYLDIKETVKLYSTFVPATSEDAYCLVTVSNPDLVKLQANLFVLERTVDGDWTFSLNILLSHTYREDAGAVYDRRFLYTGISSVIVDILDKGIWCKKLLPLEAFIVVGCPPTKELRVVKKLLICPQGISNDSFRYVIKKNAYDPDRLLRPGSATVDKYVFYNFAAFDCPMAIHFESPWVPILQLWKNGKFVEEVKVEFIIYEINGMFNFNYEKYVSQTDCVSKPQTWQSMIKNQRYPDPETAWNAQNYHSCQDPMGERITDKNEEYQIMGGENRNRILFQRYNGIYIFRVIVVNPNYSFCHLTATFSVYVFGAIPIPSYSSDILLALFIVFLSSAIFFGFFLFKLKHRKSKSEIITNRSNITLLYKQND